MESKFATAKSISIDCIQIEYFRIRHVWIKGSLYQIFQPIYRFSRRESMENFNHVSIEVLSFYIYDVECAI